ncbi:MAG TPA: hypothetical protein VHU82_02125 [Vicinamibacterales bacterium]|nr:hypothetical protein [Vicinamibacterales bacterium]
MNTRRFSAFGLSAALHLSTALCVLLTFAESVSRVGGRSATASSMVVFPVVPPEDPALPGLNPGMASSHDIVTSPGQEPVLVVAGFTFDVRKVSDHAALLFPFLSPGLRLDYFGLAGSRIVSDTEWRPANAPAGHRAPPLELSDTAIQSLVDAAWSRRDRWSAFARIASLAGRYHASAGKLPAVLHAYLNQDGLQPYVDTTIRDPRLWAELGIAADHLPFIGFISRHAAAHPSTEATTELLFLLDKCAQASLDALVTLVNTNLADLQWTRRTNRGAYDVLANVQTYYRLQLSAKGLASPGALARFYDRVRLGILNGILRTTPHAYRASDAKYLIGAIEWREGKTKDAIDIWSGMSPDQTDSYAAAAADILAALREPAGAGRVNDVNRALDREHGRWVSDSFDRLRKFGYHFDTF